METAITVIGVLLIIMGIFLIISVLMQSSKDHRLSGSIAGGAETFFGKQKGKTLDALFNKLTTVVTIIFVILVLVLYVIQPEQNPYTQTIPSNDTQTEQPSDNDENADVTDNGENADVTDNGENADVADNGENADVADNGENADVTDNGENADADVAAEK